MKIKDIDVRALVPSNQYGRDNGRYVTAICPYHYETHPSLLVYSDGVICLACGARGGVVDYYAKVHGLAKVDAVNKLNELIEAGIPEREETEYVLNLPDQDLGLRLHRNLNDEAMEYYLGRGLSLETISQYQLGWGSLYDGGPVGATIPIYSGGKLRQVKQRLIHAEKDKYRALTGCGTHFYLGDDLKDRDEGIFITEGEFDALALRQEGFLAGTGTGGVNRFDPRWIDMIKYSNPMYCLFDNDERGNEGFKYFYKLSKGMAKRVVLPTKDVSDFFLKYTRDDFVECVYDCE